MAIFNPQVQPANDPNYLGYSKGIEGSFGVDKSTGIGLETAAHGLETGVSIVDTGIKKYLSDDVRNTVEKERSDYTDYLVSLKTMAATNKIPGAGTGASTDSLLDANASADIPDGLQSGLDNAKSLAAGANTGNKINDTLYSARLAASASELRNKWSGYKDYIDSKFSEYSGMNPANAYYKNLMQDINTLAANANKDATGARSIITEAVKAGDVPNADKIWTLWTAKKMTDDEMVHQVFKARELKAAATAAEAARVARKGDRDDTAAVATRDFSQEFGGKVQQDMGLIQIGTGTQTLASAVNWITQMSQNPAAADPKQVQAVVTALNAKVDQLASEGMSRAVERDKSGQSYVTRMGGVAKVREEIEGHLTPLRDYVKSVTSQQWGLGTYLQRQIVAQSQQDQVELLDDPFMRKSKAIQDTFPTYGDVYLKAGMLGNVPDKLNNYLQGVRIPILVQSDFLSKGKVSTIKDAMDGIDKKLGDNPTYTANDVAKMKNEVFNIPKTIADPKAPIEAKANIARGAFDPSNIGILQGIKMDYTDPQTGRVIPGKYSAFTRMSSPDITDGMDAVRKGTKDGPVLWDNYKNWTKTEFQKLFREDLVSLNTSNITNPYASGGSLTEASSKLHIGWNAGEGGEPPRMKLIDDKGNDFDPRNALGSLGAAARNIQTTITRINSAMYNLHQVYRKDGEDTNMPILQDMLQSWTPDEKTTGLPGKVMDAIILANKSKLQKMEDTFFPGAKQ